MPQRPLSRHSTAERRTFRAPFRALTPSSWIAPDGQAGDGHAVDLEQRNAGGQRGVGQLVVDRQLARIDAEEDVALEEAPLAGLELGRAGGLGAHRHLGRRAIVEKQLLEPHLRRAKTIDSAADVRPLLDRHRRRAIQHRPVAHDQQRLAGRPAQSQPAQADALAIGLAGVAGQHDVVAADRQPQGLGDGPQRAVGG